MNIITSTRSAIVAIAAELLDGRSLDDEQHVISARITAARAARDQHRSIQGMSFLEWSDMADRLDVHVLEAELHLRAYALLQHIMAWNGWNGWNPPPDPASAALLGFTAPPAPAVEVSPCPQCGAPLGPSWLYDACTACEWHA